MPIDDSNKFDYGLGGSPWEKHKGEEPQEAEGARTARRPFKRFAPNSPRPSSDKLRLWHIGRLFDDNGDFLNDSMKNIFYHFLQNPSSAINAEQLAEELIINPFEVRSSCRQMLAAQLLEAAPPLSTIDTFRLSTDPRASKLLIRQFDQFQLTDAERARILAAVYPNGLTH